MAQYSLFVLKVPLYTDQSTSQALNLTFVFCCWMAYCAASHIYRYRAEVKNGSVQQLEDWLVQLWTKARVCIFTRLVTVRIEESVPVRICVSVITTEIMCAFLRWYDFWCCDPPLDFTWNAVKVQFSWRHRSHFNTECSKSLEAVAFPRPSFTVLPQTPWTGQRGEEAG